MFYLYKMIFLLTLMLGTLLTISSFNWMSMWLGLEINLLSIIPLMNNSKNLMTNESTIKYFIVQVVASSVFLTSIFIMNMNMNINMMTCMSMMMKMGAAPLHFWFPTIMEGLSWMNCILMSTWQKIAPSMILMFNMNEKISMIFIISSMIIGGIMGINHTSLRKIMAYSSINHMGWMISTLMMSMQTWMNYFLMYVIMTSSIMMTMKTMNTFYLNQMNEMMSSDKMIKLMFSINFLSLAGIPPFLGFFPKWLIIKQMIENSWYNLIMIMMMTTILSMFFYLRMIMTTFTLNSMNMNTMKNNQKIYMIMSFTTMNLLMLTILINQLN